MLDEAYLKRLGQHLGGGTVAELIDDGLIELTDRLGRLREFVERGEAEAAARLSHDLIAIAGHLGLTALSLAAVELNRRARQNPEGDAVALDGAARPVLALADTSFSSLRAARTRLEA